MRTRSMRGVHVDFSRFINEQGDAVALGNASQNARGDLVDRRGNVVQTRADISAAYHNNVERSVRHVSIKALEDTFVTPAAGWAAAQEQARSAAAQPVPAVDPQTPTRPAAKGRKITDSE